MGVKREFKSKPRGKVCKTRRPILLVIAEGKNKTEKIYFPHFSSRDQFYRIQVFSTGDTDPQGMLSALKKKYHEYEMSTENNDMAYVVLDLDCDAQKADKISLLNTKNNSRFRFIVSNPSIELWFLLHFRFTTKEFLNQADVITALKEELPGYEKNVDIFPALEKHLDRAIDNSHRLINYHEGKPWPSPKCNPRTDMPELIQQLCRKISK